jgi:hypothetical protein
MSLVGSLEDLALGDILQIVSLARKSGLLLLRTEGGDGRIVFQDGLVRAAYAKGQPEDLAGVLIASRLATPEVASQAVEDAREAGRPPAELLTERTGLTAERIDALRREHVERVVVRMFRWKVGEFSFDVRKDIDPRDQELALSVGINPQFLSMEAARIGDEEDAIDLKLAEDFRFSGEGTDGDDREWESGPSQVDAAPAASFDTPAVDAAPTASFEAPAADVAPAAFIAAPAVDVAPVSSFDARAVDAAPAASFDAPGMDDAPDDPRNVLALATAATQAKQAEPRAGLPWEGEIDPAAAVVVTEPVAMVEPPPVVAEPRIEPPPVIAEPPIEPPPVIAEPPIEPPPELPLVGVAGSAQPGVADSEPAPVEQATVPLVVIDAELRPLEWIKSTVDDQFQRVHIFQHVEGGIGRIRQYLMRGQLPTVLVSVEVPADSLSEKSGSAALVRRLRSQASRMPILALYQGDEPGFDEADALVARPPTSVLNDRRRQAEVEEAARALRAALEPWSRSDIASEARPDRRATLRSADEAALERLREISDRLRDPATVGDVLTLVMEFAAESFQRVAMFMVRDDEVVGISQRGLATAGGPDEATFRKMRVPLDEPACFHEVLANRRPHRLVPDKDGDRQLTGRLGNAHPREIYVAPIESGGRVAAILYADNLPGPRRMRDPAALTVVLHEAGLALDRALLERALAEAKGEARGA